MVYEEIGLNLDYQEMDLPQPSRVPKLTAYCASVSKEIHAGPRPAVVLCPGGGYAMTSDREAEPVALTLVAKGIQVFVLRYAVNPDRYPLALIQLAKAVAIVRERASYYNVDPNQIGVAGFSAGGHLAASLCVFWKEPWLSKLLQLQPDQIQPNFQVLSYPVITSGTHKHSSSFELLLGDRYDELVTKMSLESQVNDSVPPTFIWHTDADPSVPVENTLLYASALKKYRIPLELHIFDRGAHGLGLGNELTMSPDGYGKEVAVTIWIDLMFAWLKRNLA